MKQVHINVILALLAIAILSSCANNPAKGPNPGVQNIPNNSIAAKESPVDAIQCDKIKSKEQKDDCYYTSSMAKNDPSLCNMIEGGYLNTKCHFKFADTAKALSICDSNNNTDYKYQCYSIVASAKKDSSICDKILSSDYKSYCYKTASTGKTAQSS